MTQATRNGLIGILDAPAVAEIDQAVMDAYLAPYSSHADYVTRATGETVYLAVQATAEYHEHWNDPRYMFPSKPGGASTVTETPAERKRRHANECGGTLRGFGAPDPESCAEFVCDTCDYVYNVNDEVRLSIRLGDSAAPWLDTNARRAGRTPPQAKTNETTTP